MTSEICHSVPSSTLTKHHPETCLLLFRWNLSIAPPRDDPTAWNWPAAWPWKWTTTWRITTIPSTTTTTMKTTVVPSTEITTRLGTKRKGERQLTFQKNSLMVSGQFYVYRDYKCSRLLVTGIYIFWVLGIAKGLGIYILSKVEAIKKIQDLFLELHHLDVIR